jgi:glyoxylase-like metal-dependent hydrolase (beta-lactamase superfamily II)
MVRRSTRRGDSRGRRPGCRVARVACLLLALAPHVRGTAGEELRNAPAPVPAEARVPEGGRPVAAEALARNVYVLRGLPGTAEATGGRNGNVGLVVGPRGVVVVDSGGSAAHGRDVIAAVARITERPIRLVVLTHAGQESIFGAAAFQEAGIPVLMHRNAARLMAERCDGCLRRLQDALGERTMAGTRVVTPDRLVLRGGPLDVIGRRLFLIAPAATHAIGAMAVLDPQTRTLFAGSLVAIQRVPDMRDTDGTGWPDALAELGRTRCAHLVPSVGRLGTCSDLAPMAGYFAALDRRVRELLRDDVGLAEVAARSTLPQFDAWDGYTDLHAQNAQRAYLRLECSLFIH